MILIGLHARDRFAASSSVSYVCVGPDCFEEHYYRSSPSSRAPFPCGARVAPRSTRVAPRRGVGITHDRFRDTKFLKVIRNFFKHFVFFYISLFVLSTRSTRTNTVLADTTFHIFYRIFNTRRFLVFVHSRIRDGEISKRQIDSCEMYKYYNNLQPIQFDRSHPIFAICIHVYRK